MMRALDIMVAERRKSPRRAISQMVKLELDDDTTGDRPGLLVTDVSDGGARLFAQGVVLPATFTVVFVESGLRRKCRKVWSLGPETGVEFVDRNSRASKKHVSGAARHRA